MSTPIYIGYYFTIDPLQPASEILIAELGYVGFESFVETEKGIEAFIQKDDWNDQILDEIHVLTSGEFAITYTTKEIEQVNWNTEWEKNFTPIIVDNLCSVRAPFHEKPDTTYDIVIEPKMSFGTGHHETTHMMIQHLLKNNLQDKKVLDMGCGTGVLAILAEMRGAGPIDAIDIDNWCYLNTIENVTRNHCKEITAYEGEASLLEGKSYDVVIANINRNILLNDIASYAKTLKSGGMLFLSGFYKEDLNIITKACTGNNLEFSEHKERNNWIAACYTLK
ncbi:50S ribosomal protein L11 methyltransferase [Aquimarina addita]|uniref:Ribosomal protein L11 methyltransferase n=1 Tax=Aquimarina addita TaxID=870485 RepID=A0ABP7XE25_9FLAO